MSLEKQSESEEISTKSEGFVRAKVRSWGVKWNHAPPPRAICQPPCDTFEFWEVGTCGPGCQVNSQAEAELGSGQRPVWDERTGQQVAKARQQGIAGAG